MCRVLSSGMTLIVLALATTASAISYSFMAFFDSDSTILNAEAISTVRAFTRYCRPTGKYGVGVNGHSDTAEDAAHGTALSLRRAEAVKQALIREGMPAEVIFTFGRGATQLLVQTPDGVKEPQNRRVDLVCRN